MCDRSWPSPSLVGMVSYQREGTCLGSERVTSLSLTFCPVGCCPLEAGTVTPHVPKIDLLFPSQPQGQVVHVGLNLPQRDCASQPQVLPMSTNPNTSVAKSRYPGASWIPPGCPTFHNKASSVDGATFQASQGQEFMLSLSLVTTTQWWAGPLFGCSG